jgi:bacillithiol biosynthesis cysteine-adding enzyme BshC
LTSQLISPSKSLGYSDIYLDFVAGSGPATRFYRAADVRSVADMMDSVDYPRDRMADILIKQNRDYSASEKTFEAIERLRDPRSVVVFSGQQAGLLTGPMLTLLKALSTVKAAAAYAEQIGRPVVPIFWIAGDDHDFEEVNHASVLDHEGDLVEIGYNSPPQSAAPIAEISFDDSNELARFKSSLRDALGETDFTPRLYDLIDAAYTPDDTFVTAFGKMMAGLTRDFGLVLFCPGDADAKRVAVPFFKAIVEKQDELHDLIVTRNQEIEESGYHIQVEKKDNASHLFYKLTNRTPIMREGSEFIAGDHRFSKSELLDAIEAEPEKFSPDVMTRPVFQSYLFPTVSQKGGPAEIAYLAQINPVFDVFGLPAPYYRARPSVTVLEKRFEKLMKREEITFEDLTGDIEQVINKVLARTFPDNLEAQFEQLRRHLKTHFEDLTASALRFDPSLKQFSKQTSGKIDYAVKAFEGKVFASHKKKSQESRDRIYRLWHALYPNRALQERTLNISYFISKYDFEIISFIYKRMDSEQSSHQLISLSEYKV